MNRFLWLALLPLSLSVQTPAHWYRKQTGERLPLSARSTIPDSLFSGNLFRCRPGIPGSSLLAEASGLACLSDEMTSISLRIDAAQGETGNQIRLAKLLFDTRQQAIDRYRILRHKSRRLPVFQRHLQAYALDGPAALTRYDSRIVSLLGTSLPPLHR